MSDSVNWEKQDGKEVKRRGSSSNISMENRYFTFTLYPPQQKQTCALARPAITTMWVMPHSCWLDGWLPQFPRVWELFIITINHVTHTLKLTLLLVWYGALRHSCQCKHVSPALHLVCHAQSSGWAIIAVGFLARWQVNNDSAVFSPMNLVWPRHSNFCWPSRWSYTWVIRQLFDGKEVRKFPFFLKRTSYGRCCYPVNSPHTWVSSWPVDYGS